MLIQQNSYDSSPFVDVAIKSIVRHPNYSNMTEQNNIALLELESFVKFNDKIRPACLNYDASNKKRELINIGWGAIDSDGEIKLYEEIGLMIL